MPANVLITGGAGFIGSHLARRLLAAGYRVRVLDSLIEQVHPGGERPAHLDPDVELVVGDVRDRAAVDRALGGIDEVVHLAARVGVGQSMYEIAEYTSVNAHGTGVLLEALIDRPVRKLLVASSMSVYGEGLYARDDGRRVADCERTPAQLERAQWEPVGPGGERLAPVPTPESKPPSLPSIYALGKFDQERICLLFGSAYGVPTVALRLFNVYGRHQTLSNPYTGVLAVFAARLLNDNAPLIFEDGRQRRDFVHVSDVAEACRLALQTHDADGSAVNVASGRSVSVAELATRLAQALGKDRIEPRVTGNYRVGDIRHCFADISLARDALRFEPRVGLEEGMDDFADWLDGQVAIDRVEHAARELAQRGLTQDTAQRYGAACMPNSSA
jgi:dTDP-L-rhamnose 4-epimerase